MYQKAFFCIKYIIAKIKVNTILEKKREMEVSVKNNELLWLGNGTLVLPDRICRSGSLLIQNGKIAAVNASCPKGAVSADMRGYCILPGFIDLHVHGGGGSDVMDGDPESILQVARAHCQHGTTALTPTTMTCADDLLEKVIRSYRKAKAVGSDGAELLGLHLEGPFFAAAGKGAQPVTEQRIPTREILEHIIALGAGQIVRWDEAPELPNTDIFAEVMRENGIMASIAHTNATAQQANAAFNAGFSHVTHFYSATPWGHKVDGIVYGGVNETTLLRDDITIELIADGCHIPHESFLLAYRLKGPDKIALITDAMRAAGTDQKQSILGSKENGVPVVIRDGVAQLPDFSSYAGSIGTMDRALRMVHLRDGIPLPEVCRMLSLTPAKLLKCADRKGSLEKGKDADVVIMDPSFEVKAVFVHGILRYKNDGFQLSI